MKGNKLVPILLAALLVTVTRPTPSQAGSSSCYRWEGFALGVGTAMVAGAFLNHGRSCYYPPRHYRRWGPWAPRYWGPPCRPPLRRCRGFYEIKREWIPPTYERVWVEGYTYTVIQRADGYRAADGRWIESHYRPVREWVPAHWEERLLREGYWKEERVWVPSRYAACR
jgi:hypothetical protein